MVTPWEAIIRPVESRGTWAAEWYSAEGVLRTAWKTNMQSQVETTWSAVNFSIRFSGFDKLARLSIMPTYLDLECAEHAYVFGFLQGDGHLFRMKGHRNKGSLSVELSLIDRELLERFRQMFPFYSSVSVRCRTTNFCVDHESAVWSVSHQAFRDELKMLGLPIGRKSECVTLPSVPFSIVDYFRGWIDADGSLGLIKSGVPFLSLTTSSDHIATAYMDFLYSVTGKRKQQGRNKRDNVYNILIFKEEAQLVASVLYYEGCLALPRKQAKANEISLWMRPSDMKRMCDRKHWTRSEDEYLLSHTIRESMIALQRSVNSVTVRRRRLRRAAKNRQVTD